MSLLLASASLAQPAIGLNDIRRFATQCRDGASSGGPEAAALILLALKANSFYERVEGVALTGASMRTFTHLLASDIDHLRRAVAAGDAALVEALNTFASAFSRDVAIS